MNQSRRGSLIEALFNVAIGLLVSFIANSLVFPRFGFHPSAGENISISLIYTAISIARQYVLRRWFNARLHAAAMKLAGSSVADDEHLRDLVTHGISVQVIRSRDFNIHTGEGGK